MDLEEETTKQRQRQKTLENGVGNIFQLPWHFGLRSV
jgi:hypothetical protein